MKILLVNPLYPITYWGFQYTHRFTGASAALPPLGLLTLAALLPADWQLRLVDLNVEELAEGDLVWADAVFVGGMRIQAPSMHDTIARARAAGRRVVVGGAAPTTSPAEFADADLVFQGEAEGRIDQLIAALEAPAGAVRRLPPGDSYPDISSSPVPRFDLLKADRYDNLSVQVSRGCPYRCEFCDIIEVFGRVPRVKSADQVIAELDALRALGLSGGLFVVDDNFIGNRRATHELLLELTAYQELHGYPFDLLTEASINLAADESLVREMVAAGFTGVFVGIESPTEAALAAAKKTQNVQVDLQQAVAALSVAGLEVMGGFIVGFDQDDPDVFELQRAFIQASPIPIAMVGLLTALPGTQLTRRLLREKRLRSAGNGDQFERPNFVPQMDEETLLAGYGDLLDALYEPAAYYERCERHLMQAPPTPGRSRFRMRDVWRLLRALWILGVMGSARRHFWRFLRRIRKHARHNMRRAVVLAAMGEHMMLYTRDHVRPRLAEALLGVRAERAGAERERRAS